MPPIDERLDRIRADAAMQDPTSLVTRRALPSTSGRATWPQSRSGTASHFGRFAAS